MSRDVDSTVFLRPTRDRRQIPDRRAHWRGGRRAADFSSPVRALAARVIGEYADQPGLMLTLLQARGARWDLAPSSSQPPTPHRQQQSRRRAHHAEKTDCRH